MFKQIRENTRNLSNLFSISWSWSDSEHCLDGKELKDPVGPKIILMTLYSIFLQTDNSLFPPLE